MYMSTDKFIWYLYTRTGYYAYVGALPGGSQRQANLKVLFERAKQFEETSLKGIFNFVNFIEKLKSLVLIWEVQKHLVRMQMLLE